MAATPKSINALEIDQHYGELVEVDTHYDEDEVVGSGGAAVAWCKVTIKGILESYDKSKNAATVRTTTRKITVGPIDDIRLV